MQTNSIMLAFHNSPSEETNSRIAVVFDSYFSFRIIAPCSDIPDVVLLCKN